MIRTQSIISVTEAGAKGASEAIGASAKLRRRRNTKEKLKAVGKSMRTQDQSSPLRVPVQLQSWIYGDVVNRSSKRIIKMY